MSQKHYSHGLDEPILQHQEPMTMEQREKKLKDTIKSIGNDKNTRGEVDVNKAFKLVKQAVHRAYKIFKLEVEALGENASVEGKQAALKKLAGFYNDISLKLANDVSGDMSKFQRKRLINLQHKIQNTKAKIEVSIGESPNGDFNWEKVNLIGEKSFKAKDFRVLKKKISPLKKLKEALKPKNKSAKVHDMGGEENEQFGL